MVLVFCQVEKTNYILLIKRANPLYQHHWAFPREFVDIDEDLNTATYRELKEETALETICLK